MAEIRFDRNRLAKATRTPQGFARIDARLTRTGILKYVRGDGSVQLEYRPEEEVFKAVSLDSLTVSPLTDLHPDVFITIDNNKSFNVGRLDGVRQDGKFVAATVTVMDGPTLKKIDSGDRQEISCGYSCDLDMTPGVFEGQRYDAVQRNIEYNHVAIGPKDWGRAGNDVALRLDSRTSRFDESASASEAERESARDNPETLYSKVAMKIGDIELKIDERDAAIVAAELRRLDAVNKASEAKLVEAQAAAGKAAADLAVLKTRSDAAEARIAKLDRADLEASAHVALGAEAKFDGQTDAQLRAAVVAKVFPTLHVDGQDEAFVKGAFASAVGHAAEAAKQLAAAGGASGAAALHTDSNKDASAKAREDMIAARAKAAQKVVA